MSHIVTLYRIPPSAFAKIAKKRIGVDIISLTEANVSPGNTVDGLKFVLSKGRDKAVVKLVDQLFEPAIFLGEELDYDQIESYNWDDPALYYHTPEMVDKLSGFLGSISTEQFSALFDPDELNKHGIYPAGAWNNSDDPYREYNLSFLLSRFDALKAFMSAAKGNYVWCYIK
jgi:hypothetical protein